MDDTLLAKSPRRPGTPRKLGATVMRKRGDQVDINAIHLLHEPSSIRFHLGYCYCGKEITAGYERLDLLLDVLEAHHFPRRRKKIPLRKRLSGWLGRG